MRRVLESLSEPDQLRILDLEGDILAIKQQMVGADKDTKDALKQDIEAIKQTIQDIKDTPVEESKRPPLNEGVSKVVFHATQARKALEILQSDEFVLTTNLGTSSDQIGANKFYYFSVSRIKWGGYNRGEFYEKNPGVILELDGDKFNQRYKGGPVDYWGPSFRTPDIPKESRLRSDENEERVFSNDPIIPRASSYILGVHLYIPEEEEEHDYELIRMKIDFTTITSSRNVPLYVYKNFSDFKLLNTRKANVPEKRVSRIDVFIDTLQAVLDNDLKRAFSLDYEITDGLVRANNYNTPIEQLLKDQFDPVSERIRGIQADIHNLRSQPKFEQEPIHRLTQFMRKMKARDFAELLQAVVDRMERR